MAAEGTPLPIVSPADKSHVLRLRSTGRLGVTATRNYRLHHCSKRLRRSLELSRARQDPSLSKWKKLLSDRHRCGRLLLPRTVYGFLSRSLPVSCVRSSNSPLPTASPVPELYGTRTPRRRLRSYSCEAEVTELRFGRWVGGSYARNGWCSGLKIYELQ